MPAQPASWTDLATALIEREVLRTSREDTKRADKDVESARAALHALIEESDAPLSMTAAFAELEPAEAEVLALCAAVEVDRRLQRLVASLTADPLNFRLDLDLLVSLLGPAALAAVKPDATLIASGLLELDAEAPLAAARVRMPQLVSWAMLGEALLDPELPADSHVVVSEEAHEDRPTRLLVHGPDRVRRVQAATEAAWGLLYLVTKPPVDERGWLAVFRQATAYGMTLLLDLDAPLDLIGRTQLARVPHLPLVLSSKSPLPLESLPEFEFAELEIGDERVTEVEWKSLLPASPLPSRLPTAEQAEALARVANAASPLARLASGSLLKHARRVVPQATWDDLILPPAQSARLRDLVGRYRHRRTVHDEWGLKLYPSPGVVALFSGISGTGKTTAAEVIAHDLGIDMFRVDLSALVSKYIGETEKNLEEIFSAAHAGEYLLLFDEADSLFGNRSAVNDSRDRYANMEVSYLLQRLETYDGFVVMTSNFQGNIDDAFLRRIHSSVHFTMPTPEDRERIWDRCLAGAPRGEDLDLAHIAKTFEIAGGAIRNASLTAAFLAASRGEPVGMGIALEAVVQEFGKLRQRVTKIQLGPTWGHLVDA